MAEFLGGPPERFGEHYREADPVALAIPRVPQRLIHGMQDNVVPIELSRRYRDVKRKAGEAVELVEIPKAGHFELIDPRVEAWKKVEEAVTELLS